LFSVNCPDVMAPLHELDPSYVPLSELAEIVAFPATFAEQVL
jgi:hypothetical protein